MNNKGRTKAFICKLTPQEHFILGCVAAKMGETKSEAVRQMINVYAQMNQVDPNREIKRVSQLVIGHEPS